MFITSIFPSVFSLPSMLYGTKFKENWTTSDVSLILVFDAFITSNTLNLAFPFGSNFPKKLDLVSLEYFPA